MEQLSADLENTIKHIKTDEETTDVIIQKFGVEAKSKIHYWLSVLYDEMEAREKNLETAYTGAQEIIKKLRESQNVSRPKNIEIGRVTELVTRKLDDR